MKSIAKKRSQFKEGDKVFAKVKGYAAWPATIVSKKASKFNVQFYGTGDTSLGTDAFITGPIPEGICRQTPVEAYGDCAMIPYMGFVKADELFYYLRNKATLAKGSKKRQFLDGIAEIESAIAAEGGTDGDEEFNSGNVVVNTSIKRKRTISDKSIDSQSSKRGRKTPAPTPVTTTIEDTADSLVIESIHNEHEDETISNSGPNIKDTVSEVKDDEVTLTSEQDLQHWIIYSEYVKENSDKGYIGKVPDERDYGPMQVFPVMVHSSGNYVALKLHKSWPVKFEDEFENAMYELEVASTLLALKDRVSNGEVNAESDPDLFLSDFNMTEDEIKQNIDLKQMDQKQKRVARLRREFKMVDLDVKIKNCLGLNKPEPERALSYLRDLMDIDFDAIMLKKHSHIPEMIRRLRRYIGNVDEWNLSAEGNAAFSSNAQKIRDEANEAYKKIRSVVKLPSETANFWDEFNEEVKKFKKDCEGLTNTDVYTLCAEPLSRRAFIDRLEQNEGMEGSLTPHHVDDEVEKENSSEVANSENKVTDAE